EDENTSAALEWRCSETHIGSDASGTSRSRTFPNMPLLLPARTRPMIEGWPPSGATHDQGACHAQYRPERDSAPENPAPASRSGALGAATTLALDPGRGTGSPGSEAAEAAAARPHDLGRSHPARARASRGRRGSEHGPAHLDQVVEQHELGDAQRQNERERAQRQAIQATYVALHGEGHRRDAGDQRAAVRIA